MNDMEIKEATERGIKVWPDRVATRRTGRARRFLGGRGSPGRGRIGLWGCPINAWKAAA